MMIAASLCLACWLTELLAWKVSLLDELSSGCETRIWLRTWSL